MSHFFNRFKEHAILVGVYSRVRFWSLIEYLKVFFKYYSNIKFAKIDTLLLLSYFFSSPFRVSKRFLIQKGEQDVYCYGETPLTALDQIVQQCGITSKDTVFELGCGTARTCFWLNQWIGCKVIGVDFIPTFIVKAQKIKEYFSLSGMTFRLEDLFQTNLEGATVIYFYGTSFSDDEIKKLIKHLSRLPKKTKIITVSYSLTEIDSEAPFQVIKHFSARFTWGEAEVYLQTIK